jgi:hypothetical protein
VIPGVPTNYQGPFVAGCTVFLCLPLVVAITTQQSALRDKAIARSQAETAVTENILQLSLKAEEDMKISLERAKNCQIITPKTPLVQIPAQSGSPEPKP